MAREKIRNSKEEEAVKEDQEQPPSPTNRTMHAPLKKKGSQKRSGDQESDGMSHELVGRKGSGGSSGSKNTFHRSNKTLAWFMTDELLTTTDSHPVKNNITYSSSDLSTVTDMKGVEDKKRSKRVRQRPQKKVVEIKQRTDSTSNSEDSHDSKPPHKGENGKDDYWYYDPTSDGFYYEKTGSRGWRRRVPVNVQKRAQYEQDMYAACSRDPQQMAYFQAGLYGYGPDMAAYNAAYFAGPQIRYYDPASDGYFFEMPSVDGWKRRQPQHPSSAPTHSNSMRFGMMPPNFMHQQPQVTSYGAALARGQLPPAYTLADSAVCSQEPFSSGTSSMSTASSLSEGNPSPPPNYNSKDSLFQSDEDLDEYLAQQYDHALQIEELTKDDDNEALCKIKEQPTPIIRKPITYANVAATSYDSDDVENRPPKDSDMKRPGSLPLRGSGEAQKKRDGHELLMNFNADKFIADIANNGLDAERVLCDLASLKTPVTSSTACGLGSPQTPAIYSAFPNWARSLDSHNTNDWWADSANNAFLNKIWSEDYDSGSKSKLSMWCEAGVRTAVQVDNH